MIRAMTPVSLAITPRYPSPSMIMAAMSIIIRSRPRPEISALIGEIRAAAPMMSRILAVFEPTTFPIAIAGAPSTLAFRETSSSGMEVPKPTTVKPISNGGIRRRLASDTEPLTRYSAPAVSSARPPSRNNKSAITIDLKRP